MEYQGLLGRYPVNRPLTEKEKQDHLAQTERQAVEPYYQLSVIRMNSTYLECVDKFFAWKGLVTMIALVGICYALGSFGSFLWISIHRFHELTQNERIEEILWLGAMALFITIPALIFFIWALHRECFRLTHYPMRFNRKNRRVYVTRLDGTIFSIAWEDLYFTLGCAPKYKNRANGTWEVRAHVLDSDGETVLETFALPYFTDRRYELMLSQWEFVRRYMEEGPALLIGQIEYTMRVAHQKETFWNGFRRLMSEFASAPIILYFLMMPFLFLCALGRQFAKWTCKIPVWPEKIEQECAIEPGDPYLKE